MSKKSRPVIENLIKSIEPLSHFSCNFSLSRSGACEIVWDDNTQVLKEAPEINPNIDDQQTLHAVVSQAYYFLRDVTHRHQHHNPRTDTILDIYESKNDDDDLWRRETLYSLFRKIIHSKRIKERRSVANSLGLLAYAQAFVDICDRDKKCEKLPIYNFKALQQSMEGAHVRIQMETDAKKISSEKRWSTGFSITAIFVSLAILAKTQDIKFENLHYTIKFLFTEATLNTWRFGLWAMAATWVISVFRIGVLNVENWRWIRILIVFGHSLPRNVLISILTAPFLVYCCLISYIFLF